jgi:hypothetical protein
MEAWFEALVRGRAMVSSGPLLELQIGSALPGDTVSLSSGGGSVVITGQLRSIEQLEDVSLVCNGEEIERFPIRGDGTRLDLRYEMKINRSGWCHLRTEGLPQDSGVFDVNYAQAFTNPIWFEVDNQPIRNPGAAQYALDWIDKLQSLAEEWPGWRSQAEKDHVYSQFDEARQIYRKNLH